MKTNTLDFIHKGRFKLGVGLLLLAVSLRVAAVPLLLEGPISAVTANPDGSGNITVLGVLVNIPAGTPITTPTASLTIDQAADPTPLPGRIQPGFLGGTAIIEGDSVLGVNTASSLFMEPSENILGADVTSVPPAAIEIGGTTLQALTDARIPADPVMNDFGFEVDPASVPTGVDAVAEGYFSNNGSGIFNYFALAVADGVMINAGQPEISITRAQCIAGANPGDPIELRVLGAVHDPALVSITLKDFGPTTFDIQSSAINADNPVFGDYSFNVRNNPAFQVCPASVTAEFTVNLGIPPTPTVISAFAAVAGGSADADGDGVEDAIDNCTNHENGTLLPVGESAISQRDTDGDGYGNVCDADLDQSGVVSFTDFNLFRGVFGTADPDADLDGSGTVSFTDFNLFRSLFGGTPGPSALAP